MYKAVLHRPVEENDRDIVRGNYETVTKAIQEVNLQQVFGVGSIIKGGKANKRAALALPFFQRVGEDLAAVIDENEMNLYNFFTSIKNFYEGDGFMNTMEYSSFIRLLTDTIKIEIIVEEEIEEEDFETENNVLL